MNDIIKIETISKLHELLDHDSPKHPLISLIDLSKIKIDKEFIGKKIIYGFYSIYLKDSCNAEVIYGRNLYDFTNGVMNFYAPEQSIMIDKLDEKTVMKGYGLFFHPDLIRRSSLVEKINSYGFFSYSSYEALHISDAERKIVENIFLEIKNELLQNMDIYSKDLLISNINLLLNYSNRFYGRQFITRENLNKDLIENLEKYIQNRLNSESYKNLPTVKDCAEHLCLSPNYLSDLLKKECGKNAIDFIHYHILEKAKNILLNSNKTVNEIAYDLGFDYPEYFSRLFKKKVGVSPSNYRKNIN